ncbi:hypothetical protein PCURB6_44090 [Paenibacillus curdlanolyticus]|nr:hypothetical protein [Paenibacillus curdlanolyticus]GFN34149.1 hypothetical protein PCURB6_44090 [Paenibacillus curdlanolyticus]
MNEIMKYAKEHSAEFECSSVSSNEIRPFEYKGKKYILKLPLMTGDNLSPFWLMMKNIFHFTFEKQNENMEKVYDILRQNPYIKMAPLVAADKDAVIYEHMEGDSWHEDKFPEGKNNAFLLGQFVGYNHRVPHERCGIIGATDVADFFARSISHMEQVIEAHWNGEEEIDKKVRLYFNKLKERTFSNSKYSVIMGDFSADQFLYVDGEIASCIDLDAYVIGPVEWELSFLRRQVSDWDSFKAGYETFQSMPYWESSSEFFYFLMALNPNWDKGEMEASLSSIK